MRWIKPYIFYSILPALLFCCSGAGLIGPDKPEQDREVRKCEEQYSSDLWTERVLSLEKVSSLNRPKAEYLLLRGLEDPHIRVRLAAVKGLASFKNDAAFFSVLSLAEADPDTNVKWESLKTLAAFKRAESVPLLTSLFRSTDWVLREASISALLDIEDPAVRTASIPIAIDALNDVNENVRIAAMMHLKVTDPMIYSILARQISGGMYYRRPGYLNALLCAVSSYKIDKDVRAVILTFLTHPNPEIRVLSLRAVKNSDEMK